jgi:hypothetical protein
MAAKADINAAKMKGVIAQKKASGKKITMAMTFPGGTHDLWIRYWLAAGGIDPDKDIDLITVPPPQMVANMKADTMDAFCVGEPWNAQLVDQKLGYTAVSTGQMWMNHPEKSFDAFGLGCGASQRRHRHHRRHHRGAEVGRQSRQHQPPGHDDLGPRLSEGSRRRYRQPPSGQFRFR